MLRKHTNMNYHNILKVFFSNFTFRDWWFVTSIIVLLFGMFCSPFVASVGKGFIVAGIILNFILWKKQIVDTKQKRFFLLCIACLFLLNIVGTIWSENKTEAITVLFHSVSFLIIPLFVFLHSPIKKNVLKFIILSYLFFCLLGTIIGFFNYITNNYTDTRHIVTGTRHIAFAINIAFSTCLLMVYTYYIGKHKKIIIPIIIWQIAFLVIVQMISGLLACIIFVSIYITYLFVKQRNRLNTILFVSKVVILLALCGWIYIEYNNYFIPKEKVIKNWVLKTKEGNFYTSTDDKFIENGYFVNNYVCKKEVETEWQKLTGKSLYEKSFDTVHSFKNIVYRYLNSKGLHKDAESVRQLSKEDLDNIYKGIANVVYTERFSLRPRLYQTFHEIERFHHAKEVNYKSLIQRMAMTNSAFNIIKRYPLFGTGTADASEDLRVQLSKDYPSLSQIIKADPHNQLVYITVKFGVVGLLFFIFATLYPFIKLKLWQNKYCTTFCMVFICYMFSESCLQMMAGEIFFCLFYSLLIFDDKEIRKYYLP